MKRLALFAFVVCAALLLSAAVSATDSHAPYVGAWEGIDVDGSHVRLWISHDGWSAGRLFRVRVSDDATGAWWCGGAARGESIGVVEDDGTLSTSGAVWCLEPVENVLYFLEGGLTYDAGTDTLIDDSGVIYHRGG